MKTFNGYEVVDAKARQDIASHNTRITEVEKFFEAADTNGVIDKLAEVQKYIEDDAEAAASLVKSIADVDAKVDDIHIPEKVSELENDKGYLTEHQSLEGKADKEHTHPQYLTEHQSLDNYYTKAQTDSAIGEAVGGIKIPEVDLTPYAKVADMPTKVSQLENDANYLTEHQSLDGKADKVHTHKLNEITDYKEPDLSEYAKKTEIPSLDNVATKEYVDTADKKHTQDIANLTHHIQNIIEPTIVQKSDKGHKHTISEITDYTAPDLSGYAKKSDIPDVSNFITEVPETYATKAYVNNAVAGVEPDLTSYATKTYVTNTVQAAIDDIPAPDIPSLDGYATEQYVDDAIAAIDIPEVTVDGINAVFIDAPMVDSGDKPVPDEYVDIFRKYNSGECRDYVFYIKFGSGSTSYYQSTQVYFGNSLSLYTVPYINNTRLVHPLLLITIGDTLTWASKTTTSFDIAKKDYVDDTIAALEARIAALEGNN